MTCTCLQTTTERLHEHYKEQAGDDVHVSCQSLALILGGDQSNGPGLFFTFNIRGSKRPFNAKKGKSVNMFFRYCPFCGKRYQEEANEQVAETTQQPAVPEGTAAASVPELQDPARTGADQPD